MAESPSAAPAPATGTQLAGIVASLSVVVGAVVLGPVLAAPWADAVGSPCSEASRHVWSLAVAWESLWAGTGLRRIGDVGWPEGFSAPLLDPVSLLGFGPLAALGGPALGWNGLVLVAVACLGLGTWSLARTLRLSRVGAACLAVGALAAPWMLQLAETGRSEYLAASLWPLHLAFLLRAARGERRAALGVGLSLAAMGSAGPPLAVMLALAELPLLAVLVLRRRGRGQGPLLGGLLLGSLGAMPALWPVLTELPEKATTWGPGSPGLQEPVQTSMLSLVHLVPAALQPPTEQPATVGLALLALALVGAWREPRARAWLALGLWIWVLAQGTAPTWARDVGAVREPRIWGPVAWLVAAVPPLGAISSWSRIGCLLGVPVGIAAAAAVGRRGRLWVGVALLVALGEQLATPRPPAVAGHRLRVAPPEAYLAALESLPEGPVLQLPMDLPGVGQCVGRDRWLLWSLAHGRPVTSTPAETADQGQRLGYLGSLLTRVQQGRLGAPRVLSPDTRDCLRESVQAAERAGLAGVLVDVGEPLGRVQAQWLSASLGLPQSQQGRYQVWSLAAAPEPERRVAQCRVPTR